VIYTEVAGQRPDPERLKEKLNHYDFIRLNLPKSHQKMTTKGVLKFTD